MRSQPYLVLFFPFTRKTPLHPYPKTPPKLHTKMQLSYLFLLKRKGRTKRKVSAYGVRTVSWQGEWSTRFVFVQSKTVPSRSNLTATLPLFAQARLREHKGWTKKKRKRETALVLSQKVHRFKLGPCALLPA